MLSVATCREILGPRARDLSDAEIERRRDRLYGLAKVAFGIYRAQRGGVQQSKPATPGRSER